jgi:DNA-binding IclR family transcriptional regulator
MKRHQQRNPYHIEALLRGLNVLSLFTPETPALTITDVVRLGHLNKATAFRILTTLEAGGFLIREARTRRYRPSLRVLSLGFLALDNLSLVKATRPSLEALALQTGLVAAIHRREADRAVCTDMAGRHERGNFPRPGTWLLAHCAAPGLVMLANVPSGELDQWLMQTALQPCNAHLLPDVSTLRARLAEVRRQGYAISEAMGADDLCAVAAPLFENGTGVVAAVSVWCSRATTNDQRLYTELPAMVTETARVISRRLSSLPD